MSNEQHLIILYWQIAAALLMGIDYFLPEAAKHITDKTVREYLKGVRGKIKVDRRQAIKLIVVDNRWKLFLGVVFLAIAYLALQSMKNIDPGAPPWVTIGLPILIMIFFLGGAVPITSALAGLTVPVGVASILDGMLAFMHGKFMLQQNPRCGA